MAGAGDLLRLLGSRLRLRLPGQSRHQRDPAPAGDAGGPRAAEGVDQERARPRRSRSASASPISNSSGSATTRSIRCNRRRRSTSWSAPASRRSPKRARTWGWRRRAKAAPGFGKYNQHHDERRALHDAADAVEPGAERRDKPPKGVQVAANDDAKTKSDAGALNVRITSANDVWALSESERWLILRAGKRVMKNVSAETERGLAAFGSAGSFSPEMRSSGCFWTGRGSTIDDHDFL